MSSVTLSQTLRQESGQLQLHLIVTISHRLTALTFLSNWGIVTGSEDGTVGVWNVNSGEQVATFTVHDSEKGNGVYDLTASQDNGDRWIIICSTVQGNIKVWNLSLRRFVKEWTHSGPCPYISMVSDACLVAIGHQTVVIHSRGDSFSLYNSIKAGEGIRCMSFPLHGHKFACATDDEILLYHIHNGTLLLVCKQVRIKALLLSNDGNRLYSSSHYDKAIRCWDANTGQQIGHPWTGHVDGVVSFAVSPDESILASASWDRTVRFWNAITGDPIGNPLQHESSVQRVCFSPSGGFVASATWDGKVHLWRVPQPDTVRENQTHPALPANDLGSQAPLPHPSQDVGNGQPAHFGLEIHDQSYSTQTEGFRHFGHAQKAEGSTSVFRLLPNDASRKTRKIHIKQALVGMLREIGFRLPGNRLPWSTLAGALEKRGYTILNWPEGVVRNGDRGIYGLSAEDVDKLHNALFRDDHRLRLVRCGEGSVDHDDTSAPLTYRSREEKSSGSDRSCVRTRETQLRFKVTTAETFVQRSNKRRHT